MSDNIVGRMRYIKEYAGFIGAYLKEINDILDNETIDYDALFTMEQRVDRISENCENLKEEILKAYDDLEEE